MEQRNRNAGNRTMGPRQDPELVFSDIIDRLRDIIWWNRSLTSLHELEPDPERLERLLLDYSGPFIERVDPPAYYRNRDEQPTSWLAIADQFDIHPYVRDAVSDVLFKGNPDARLYQHQGACIERLCWQASLGKAGRDLILSVPTATGKTESVLIPILDYCCYRRTQPSYRPSPAHALKALIIYPMKALEVDQLNRFLRFLDRINRDLARDNKELLYVGIWDGDTPVQVGREDEDGDVGRVVQVGDQLRGLRCPACRTALTYTRQDAMVECESGAHRFRWIRATRTAIQQEGVDILITNPEAIEYLLIAPQNSKVLATDDLKFLFVDEAHVWTGASGAAFSLLLSRLRARYAVSRPHVVLASATIANPREFAQSLLGSQDQEVASVTFERRLLDAEPLRPVDYARIAPTNLAQILSVLKGNSTGENVGVPSDDGALAFLRSLKLADSDGSLTIDGRNLADLLVDGSPEEALDNQAFADAWASALLERLPELGDLLTNGFGGERFAAKTDLVRYIEEWAGVERGEEVLQTLLSVGRGSGLVFDKYHYFVRPGQGLYYCVDCGRVNGSRDCPAEPSHRQIAELYFCHLCHGPAYQFPDDKRGTLVSLVGSGDRCRCGEKLTAANFEDAFVHYKTLADYLVGVAPPLIPSRKLLMFVDGRELAETTADASQSLDYPLVADRLLLYLLLTQGDQSLADIANRRGSFIQSLFRLYLDDTPLGILQRHVQTTPNVQQVLRETLKAYQSSIFELARLRSRLFVPCLVTFPLIQQLGATAEERALAHTILSEIVTSRTEERVNGRLVPGVSVSALRTRILRYVGYEVEVARGAYDRTLRELTDFGYIEMQTQNDRGRSRDFYVLTREGEGAIRLTVSSGVVYCECCYHGFPDPSLTACPRCGTALCGRGPRFDAECREGGYFPNADDSPMRVLDHWAKDILVPALDLARRIAQFEPKLLLDSDGLTRTIIWSHGARTPQLLRGAIEDGFKKDLPTVNAVCCTPTMELGVDIGTLDCIVQLGIPPTRTNYVQRIGRTGRNRLSPSLIITIVRNGNAVDGYYYGDIARRFLNRPLQPSRVPRPSPTMVAQHVCAETAAFLQRSPRSNYQKYYAIFTPDAVAQAAKTNPDWVFRKCASVLYTFGKDARTHWAELIPYLERALGSNVGISSATQAMTAAMVGEESYLCSRLLDLFDGVEAFYRENPNPGIISGVAAKLTVLGRLLDTLGLFPTFRGSGGEVPIIGRGNDQRDVELAMQSNAYAVRENYPGPFEGGQPKAGALWHVAAKPFEIRKVFVKTPALQFRGGLRRCENVDGCSFAYELYEGDERVCPYCGSDLRQIDLYEYWYAEARRYRAWKIRVLETTPRIISHVAEE